MDPYHYLNWSNWRTIMIPLLSLNSRFSKEKIQIWMLDTKLKRGHYVPPTVQNFLFQRSAESLWTFQIQQIRESVIMNWYVTASFLTKCSFDSRYFDDQLGNRQVVLPLFNTLKFIRAHWQRSSSLGWRNKTGQFWMTESYEVDIMHEDKANCSIHMLIY